MLTATGRRARGIATVLVLLAIVAGTAWGEDDHFPFAPFRMFSTSNELDGEVRAAKIVGVMGDGRVEELAFDRLGLRRAEIEGQIPRFVADPSLLRHFAAAYRDSEIAEVRLVETIIQLRDGVAVYQHDEILASWSIR